nr:uncharacterized protein LOC127309824 [Lolium perenne]
MTSMPPPKGSQPIRGRRPRPSSPQVARGRTASTSCRTGTSTARRCGPPRRCGGRTRRHGDLHQQPRRREPAPSPEHELPRAVRGPPSPDGPRTGPPRRSPNEPRPPPAASADLPPAPHTRQPRRRQLDPRNHRHLAACRPSRESHGRSKKTRRRHHPWSARGFAGAPSSGGEAGERRKRAGATAAARFPVSPELGRRGVSVQSCCAFFHTRKLSM